MALLIGRIIRYFWYLLVGLWLSFRETNLYEWTFSRLKPGYKLWRQVAFVNSNGKVETLETLLDKYKRAEILSEGEMTALKRAWREYQAFDGYSYIHLSVPFALFERLRRRAVIQGLMKEAELETFEGLAARQRGRGAALNEKEAQALASLMQKFRSSMLSILSENEFGAFGMALSRENSFGRLSARGQSVRQMASKEDIKILHYLDWGNRQ